MNLDDFEKLQKRVATLQRDADKANGAVAQALSDLKAKYGVKSLEEAKALAEKLDKEADRISREYGEQREQFDETYGHLLRGDD